MSNTLTKIDGRNLYPEPLVWITKTTRDGDTNTRIGIAEHIGGSFYQLEIPSEFCTLEQVKVRLYSANLITAENIRWPDVLIGPCFHIPYMQLIKTLSGDSTIVVALRPPVRGLQIKANKQDIDKTDLIVSYPFHNNDNLPNILLCESIANRITAEHLREAKSRWANDFSPFFSHGPVIGLLMGGDIGDKRRIFSPDIAMKLGNTINRIAIKIEGSIIVSVSARTSDECKAALCSMITVPSYIYDPKDTLGDNPYFGILGSVDYIVVTADSISMCSEAASSGTPVYIFHDHKIVESSHMEVVSYLVKKGFARLLNNDVNFDKFSYTPKNSAKKIAERVHRILFEQGSKLG